MQNSLVDISIISSQRHILYFRYQNFKILPTDILLQLDEVVDVSLLAYVVFFPSILLDILHTYEFMFGNFTTCALI